MKKLIIFTLMIFINEVVVIAQISKSEFSQLTPEQQSIYLSQQEQINAEIKAAEANIRRAEEIIRMGEEMKRDNAGVAGAAHVMRGMEMKEEAETAIRNARKNQELLDVAAREAIRNNRK